jgi:hypothetical protein
MVTGSQTLQVHTAIDTGRIQSDIPVRTARSLVHGYMSTRSAPSPHQCTIEQAGECSGTGYINEMFGLNLDSHTSILVLVHRSFLQSVQVKAKILPGVFTAASRKSLHFGSRDSSVGMATGYGLDSRGVSVETRDIFPAALSILVLGNTQTPVHWVLGARITEAKPSGAWRWRLSSNWRRGK